MKFSLMLSLLIFSSVTSANIGRPRSIICTSNATSTAVQNFAIDDFNTEDPTSTIPDASFFEMDQSRVTTEISFSNECDNMYTISLDYSSLEMLKVGKIKQITGTLSYYDVELSEARNDDSNGEGESITITCKLP